MNQNFVGVVEEFVSLKLSSVIFFFLPGIEPRILHVLVSMLSVTGCNSSVYVWLKCVVAHMGHSLHKLMAHIFFWLTVWGEIWGLTYLPCILDGI